MRMACTILLVDFDLFFLVVSSTILAFRKRSREWRVSRFGIFPSDARSSRRKVGFSFYSDTSSLCCSVAPVRRREDTERDRDSGVKVQIGWSKGVFSRMPFEPFWNNSKGRQEETLASGGEGGGWGWGKKVRLTSCQQHASISRKWNCVKMMMMKQLMDQQRWWEARRW